MTIIVVGAVIAAIAAALFGQYASGLVLLLVAGGVGYITHPIRYTVDRGYRERTRRTRWA